MGDYNFSRRKCLKALKKVGFALANNRKGKHDKFIAPEKYAKNNFNQPPFIMIPRHRNLKCQFAIIEELKRIGNDELLDEFKKNL